MNFLTVTLAVVNFAPFVEFKYILLYCLRGGVTKKNTGKIGENSQRAPPFSYLIV